MSSSHRQRRRDATRPSRRRPWRCELDISSVATETEASLTAAGFIGPVSTVILAVTDPRLGDAERRAGTLELVITIYAVTTTIAAYNHLS